MSSEEMLKVGLAKIFGWSIRQVERTSFVDMMWMLINIIEENEKIIQLQNETIQESKNIINAVEKFLGQRVR